jgi:hypothetical protein
MFSAILKHFPSVLRGGEGRGVLGIFHSYLACGSEIGWDLSLFYLCPVTGQYEERLDEAVDIFIWHAEALSWLMVRR